MRCNRVVPRLATSSFLLATTVFISTVAAINSKHHPFLKRQGCNNIDSQCSSVGTTLSDCINYVCDSCTNVDPSISQCCKQTGDSNIATCIEKNLDTSTSTGLSGDTSLSNGLDSATSFTGSSRTGSATRDSFPTTTALAVSNPACSSLLSKIEACESATPGFDFIIFWTSQASCFCYDSNTYRPSSFDGYYSSCLGYLSTADPDTYSSLTVGNDDAVSTPCASAGNVKATSKAGSGNSPSQTATPAPTADSGSTPTPTSTSSGSSSGAGVSGDSSSSSSGQDMVGLHYILLFFMSFGAIFYFL
ncbi:MAG: hypothetical protein Q9220_005052 [cf. Caloplaca sp. 1 TL-2023]